MTDQSTNSASPARPSARQRAIEAYEDAGRRATNTLAEAPLLALAGGIAAGALIAALLPRTSAEERLVRPTARRLRQSAKAAVEAARTTSKERFSDLGFSRDKGQETLDNFLQGLKDTARASADAAVEAARTKR
jgi:hypothetical protein